MDYFDFLHPLFQGTFRLGRLALSLLVRHF